MGNGKIITIDWEIISQLPDDEYHLKPLSKRQSAILLALCEYQHWRTRWDNLSLSQQELDRLVGDIENRLMMSEDGGMVTKQELIEGICEGMQCYTENIAKRIISGVTSGIVIDEDGNVSVGGDGGASGELPEDNPATPYNESMMAKSGGASGVRLGINQIWASLNSSYTNGINASNAEIRLNNLFSLDPAGTTALVTKFYADKQAALPSVSSNGFSSTLDAYLFCKGISAQSVAEWIYELQTANLQDQSSYVIAALTQEQLDAWFARGTGAPSTDYLAYSCVPIPDYSFVLSAYGIAFSDTRTLKKYHRYLVTVTGYFVDADGDIQDAFWHKQVGQNEVYDPTPDLNIQISNAVKRYPTVFEAPYDPVNHRYQWTIEMGSSDASPQWTINRDTGTMAAGATSPTGGLSFTVKDLGEVVN